MTGRSKARAAGEEVARFVANTTGALVLVGGFNLVPSAQATDGGALAVMQLKLEAIVLRLDAVERQLRP